LRKGNDARRNAEWRRARAKLTEDSDRSEEQYKVGAVHTSLEKITRPKTPESPSY
jgi:hypothetical protein